VSQAAAAMLAPLMARADISVQVLAPAWRKECPAVVALARRTARATLAAALPSALRPRADCGVVEVSVVLADNAVVQRLNRDYRGLDKPTNVLSFGSPDEWRTGPPGAPIGLGDVILARETVAAEAAEQGKAMADHASHLIVHGILHLLGHDHGSDSEAAAMEGVEIDVLAGLGIADPYAALPPPRAATRRRG
jgi:probable rRNA maturation factor